MHLPLGQNQSYLLHRQAHCAIGILKGVFNKDESAKKHTWAPISASELCAAGDIFIASCRVGFDFAGEFRTSAEVPWTLSL